MKSLIEKFESKGVDPLEEASGQIKAFRHDVQRVFMMLLRKHKLTNGAPDATVAETIGDIVDDMAKEGLIQ